MTDDTIAEFGSASRPWVVPEIDRTRQATASLRGYVYQLHQSASAWIGLRDSELLVLEAAEDYAQILNEPEYLEEILLATQVKNRESGVINLNSADVLETIGALFRLQLENPGRTIRLIFLTTSQSGVERKNPLPSGRPGLEAWSAAARGGDAAEIRAALIQRLEDGDLKTFVASATEDDLRRRLLTPITFICGAPPWDLIAAANKDALVDLRGEIKATAAMAAQAYDAVIGKIIETVLSPRRTLDRPSLLALLERATAVPIPSQLAIDLLAQKTSKPSHVRADIGDLRHLSKTSLELGTPPSLAALFPDASANALAAFRTAQTFNRIVISNAVSKDMRSTAKVSELAAASERKHLILGQAGSGKTHMLWHVATNFLTAQGAVPIYLQAAQIKTWDELAATITDIAPSISIDTLLNDDRICVFIDGWSEFAVGEHAPEKTKALRALRNARVIANAKITGVDDALFKVWSLELFSRSQVIQILAQSQPGVAPLPDDVLDLLRLPLLISIHVLAGANSSEPGQLLRQFNDHLMRRLPSGLTNALAGAAAACQVAGTRDAGRFRHEFERRAKLLGIANPVSAMVSLGTVIERGGTLVPVHDLYWSWLVGLGLLLENRVQEAVVSLDTRSDLELALQSGAAATTAEVCAVTDADLVLAARLTASLSPSKVGDVFGAALDAALNDSRLSVRSRGALAALASENPAYLARALAIKRELSMANFYIAEWSDALRPSVLYPHRAVLADWMGAEGSDDVLNAIAGSGTAEWVAWLEEIAKAGKVSFVDALAAALACDPAIPAWGLPHIDQLIKTKPWKLRPVAARGANEALVRYIATNYGRLIETVIQKGSSAWIELNRVLLACGDDKLFQLLLDKFATLAPTAQELLDFAIVERGPPWVAAFQRIAFATPGGRHHRLAEFVSLDIDDATARNWIATGHGEIGWRVLIARNGEAILHELIAALPSSFAGHSYVPALTHMRFLESAPASLVDSLWNRVGSPMQPRVTQDLFNAVAKAGEPGIISIVKFVVQQGLALPAYYRQQALKIYEEWRSGSGRNVLVAMRDVPPVPFERLAVMTGALQEWEEHFTPALLASLPDAAITIVLTALEHDVPKAAAVLRELRTLKKYHAELFERMLAVPELAALIPDLFGVALDTFPADAIYRCLESSHIDQEKLLFRLGSTNNPLHRNIHAQLIEQVLLAPMNLHHFRYVANMLRAHTNYETKELLSGTNHVGTDSWLWLVREVEAARRERLINESGSLLTCG